ncbi:MAG: germination protein YpeB [Clostridium sp.]|nr:germination protein YpeB [Clostridium sp.]
MSIREKLLDFKRRLSDRKMYSIVIVAIAVVAMWGFYQYKSAASLRQELDNQYNRAFYDMLGYVNNVEVLLIKSLISNSPEKTAGTMQEAWRQANLAQTNLGQLPISQNVLSNTSKFLTQVGDLAYSLNNQGMGGESLSEEQYGLIEQLHGFSVSLEQSLNDLQNQIAAGRIKWGELEDKGKRIFKKTSEDMPNVQFENIDKTFQDYPTLIYDGPFSDHMTDAQPKGLTGEEMNVEQGKERVKSFFGQDRVEQVEDIGSNDQFSIKTYSYSVKFRDAPEDQMAMVDVAKRGGDMLWMLYNRSVDAKEQINIDQAKALGKKFLEEHGYKDMVDTYYLKEDNTAVINYAYKQGDVIVYPDLIKVKIALDDGEVIGLESKGYINNHTTRDIPQPRISIEEAQALITPRMDILSSGLAIIPTDFKSEIFTYEFKGTLNDRDFLVYINAENGREEKILMIMDTPNGVLTM